MGDEAGRTKTGGENGEKEFHGVFLKCLLKRSNNSQHQSEDNKQASQQKGKEDMVTSVIPLAPEFLQSYSWKAGWSLTSCYQTINKQQEINKVEIRT